MLSFVYCRSSGVPQCEIELGSCQYRGKIVEYLAQNFLRSDRDIIHVCTSYNIYQLWKHYEKLWSHVRIIWITIWVSQFTATIHNIRRGSSIYYGL